MKYHEFFGAYANTPLAERMVPIDVAKHGLLTLNDLFDDIKALEEKMRPISIEQDAALRIAAEYYAKK